MKHHMKILTAVLAVLLCLTGLPLTRAEAAGDYKVKETRVDDVVRYSVYSNTDESNEDHFYTSVHDVYDSTGAYHYTITFFQSMKAVDREQADALARYLAGQMPAKGYVNWRSGQNGEKFWIYRIEGWEPGESVYNLEDAGPWYNAAGEECGVTVVGRGDQVSKCLSGPGYSAAFWFPQSSPADGMTVGFSFNAG